MQLVDFFVSYTKSDNRWAEWIAWELEKADYECCLQAWDFPPGSDFMRGMRAAVESAKQVIAVLSPEYLNSDFATLELDAALARDPTGKDGILVPVRVEDFTPTGLLQSRVFIDLVGLSEIQARDVLIQGIKASRASRTKPSHVSFPGPPAFPEPVSEAVGRHTTPSKHLSSSALLVGGADLGTSSGFELHDIAQELSAVETRLLVDASVEDLAQVIASANPGIFHFSGHMNGKHVLFQSRSGVRALDYEAFAGMLRAATQPARFVYLNSSFSWDLVTNLKGTFVESAIGVPGNISKVTACRFSVEFYRNLAKGHSVVSAFDAAKAVVQTEAQNLDLDVLPQLALAPGVAAETLSFEPGELHR